MGTAPVDRVGGLIGHGVLVVEGASRLLQVLESEGAGKNFRDTCRIHPVMSAAFQKHLAGSSIHHNIGFGMDGGQFRRGDGRRRRRYRQSHQQANESFHAIATPQSDIIGYQYSIKRRKMGENFWNCFLEISSCNRRAKAHSSTLSFRANSRAWRSFSASKKTVL